MEIVAVLLDIRSAHNVGSIIRSAECFGIHTAVCVGYTPYPLIANDSRLPHIAQTTHQKIIKTSLGAEKHVDIQHAEDIFSVIKNLRIEGFKIWALEQSSTSTPIHTFNPPQKIALVFGNEPYGIPARILEAADGCLEILQFGKKESLNVSVAAGIALYEFSKYR